MKGSAGGGAREIQRLRAQLAGTVYPASAARRVDDLQRLLNARGGRLAGLRRRQARVERELAWAEEQAQGYRRALILVATPGDAPAVGRIRQRLEERAAEVAGLRAELRRLEEEASRIEAEVAIHQRALVAALRDVLAVAVPAATDSSPRAASGAAARKDRESEEPVELEEMWSPTAVLGFRAWAIEPDGLHGAWERWATPSLEARCAAGIGGRIPHTDGSCAEVAYGCGIYAAKTPGAMTRKLRRLKRLDTVVGLTGLEGKVVEHDRGYRAERATVLAVAMVERGRLRLVAEPEDVVPVFEAPSAVPLLGTLVVPADDAALRAEIRRFMKEQHRRYATWTSASNGGSSWSSP